MASTLRSIMCDKFFSWDREGGNGIVFRKDGTGNLYCGAGMSHWIAAIFNWKPLMEFSDSIDQGIQYDDDYEGWLDIEMTLLKKRVTSIGGNPTDGQTLHDTYLTEEAFRPKVYRLKLDRGKHYGLKGYICELHLLMDPSPYPPLEEWNLKNPTEFFKYWERKDFYGDRVGYIDSHDRQIFRPKAFRAEEIAWLENSS